MDRNKCAICRIKVCIVALRKESVDRNDNGNAVAVSDLVALRKESVDRNKVEMAQLPHIQVALRKESVDRNAAKQKNGGNNTGRSPQGERG